MNERMTAKSFPLMKNTQELHFLPGAVLKLGLESLSYPERWNKEWASLAAAWGVNL